jgi:putative MATE family efflux protein
MNKAERLRIDRSILKDTLRLAWPAMVESFFMAFAGLIDSYMVSTVDSFAVASVGLTTQPKMIALAMFFAVGVSTSAIVARRYGEGRRDDANKTLLTSLLFTVVCSIAVGALFVVFADEIIFLCGSSENTHEGAVDYLKIVVGSIVFHCIQLVINSAQRGAGNTRITMVTNVTSNIVNIVFNYLLIGGKFGFPRLGIRGAAIATVLGTVVSSVMSIISIIPKDRFISLKYIWENKIRPSVNAFKYVVRFGYSVFIEQILLRVGFTATAVMAANLGDNPMAAHQVAMNIVTLSFAAGDGLQAAAIALIGKNLGMKEPEKAKTYGRCCQAVGAVISVIYAILFFAGGRWLMSMFFPDKPEIVDIGAKIVMIIVPIVAFQISQVIFMGSLRGAGDTVYTAVICAFSVTFVRTIVSYVCGYTLYLGIVGVWLGIFADQFFRFVLSSIRFSRGKWVNIKV